jgi:hypothetical protein
MIHITALLLTLLHSVEWSLATSGVIYLLKQAANAALDAFANSVFRWLVVPTMDTIENTITAVRAVVLFGGVALCIAGIVAVYRCSARPQLPA